MDRRVRYQVSKDQEPNLRWSSCQTNNFQNVLVFGIYWKDDDKGPISILDHALTLTKWNSKFVHPNGGCWQRTTFDKLTFNHFYQKLSFTLAQIPLPLHFTICMLHFTFVCLIAYTFAVTLQIHVLLVFFSNTFFIPCYRLLPLTFSRFYH